MTLLLPILRGFDRLIVATHNVGKRAEFESILSPIMAGEIISSGDLALDEPEETGASFIDNARIKAMAVVKETGCPALADDSGLCVRALDNAPSIYSARWAGEPRDFSKAMEKIHTMMGDAADRSAFFEAALALALPDGRVIEAQGRVEGTIVWPPRGNNGHGYDPFFMPDGHTLTFGEMAAEDKNAISHRRRATDALIKILSDMR